MKKLVKIISLVLAMTFVFCACSNTKTSFTSDTTVPAGNVDETTANRNLLGEDLNTEKTEASDSSESVSGHKRIKFTMENGEEFIVELYPEYAPKTVDNFVKLVKQGFYNGLTFHRVVEGFMAQGGDPEGTGYGGSDEEIYGEFLSNGYSQNTLSHQRGVISMARSGDPNSASSQFFICYDDAAFLDGSYAAFGKVIKGMEVVDGFLDVERVYGSDGALSKPVEPIVIEKAEVVL